MVLTEGPPQLLRRPQQPAPPTAPARAYYATVDNRRLYHTITSSPITTYITRPHHPSPHNASNLGDIRQIYQLVCQVNGKSSALGDSVRDVNGGFIAEKSATVERRREHFEHHLNFDTQPTTPLLYSAAEFLPSPNYTVPCDPSSEGKVADSIRKIRNNKALGEDGRPAEVYESCVDTGALTP
ncbi:hypothetical protein SprV_0200648900 [Sparganum proliferum]